MEAAIFATIESGTKTKDVGGTASTSAFVDAVCARLAADSSKGRKDKASKGISVAL